MTETHALLISRKKADGIRLIGAGALAYWIYQEQHKSGVEINIGPRGVTIEGK